MRVVVSAEPMKVVLERLGKTKQNAEFLVSMQS